MAELDPTLYNGPARTEQAFPDRPVAAAQESGVVPLEDTLAPTAAFKAAEQLSTAASRPESTMLEAAQAGARSWLTMSIVDRFNKPTFEPDGTSASDQLQHAQIILSNDEADLFNKRKSIAEGNYYLDSIRKTRENAEAMKDHIGVAMITGGLDPINWAVPFGAAKAAAGAARLGLGMTAARAVASGTAAAASAGVGVAAAQVRPVRTEDIVLNTLLEGFAAPFMVPGKARVSTRGGDEVVRPSLAQADPDFPAEELRAITKPIVPATEVAPNVVPKGYTRYYHGGNSTSKDSPLWFTSELSDAEGWARRDPSMSVSYVDVPSDHLVRGGDASFGVIPPSRVELPVEFSSKRKPLISGTVETGLLGKAVGNEGAILLKEGKDSAGKFELHYMEEGAAVKMQYATREEALDAFDDAVDYAEADVLVKPSTSTDSKLGKLIGTPPISRLPVMGTGNDAYLTEAEHVLQQADTVGKYKQFTLVHTVTEDEEHAVVAYANGKPVGQLNFVLEEGFAPDVHVQTTFQRQGLGTAMYDYAQQLGWKLDTSNTVRTPAGAKFREAYDSGLANRDLVMYEDVGLGSKSGDIPEDLTPGIAHDPAKTAVAVDKLMETQAKSWSKRLGEKLQWNVRKSMAAYSDETAKTADILFDNNSNLAVNSVEAHKRIVKAELKAGMWQFDNQLNDAMAESGYGMFNQIFKKGAAEKQSVLEEQVHNEMLRRDQLSRQGIAISHTDVAPQIKAMADSLDRVAKRTAQELKAAGVKGAELLEHHSGWMSRRWDSASLDSIMQRIQKYGHSAEQSKAMVIKMVAESMADANSAKGWSWELAHDVASSTVNRALRRGALEDAAFNVNQGAEAAKVIRDMLIEDGLTGKRLQRVMDVLVGKTDEASKAGFLKHRVDLDYTTNINLGGEQINITELFDHNVKDIFDKYIDKSAAEIALARKGLTSASDVEALLAKDIASIQGMDKRQEYKTLFEESLKHLKGQASGSDLGQALRNTAAISRLTTLGSSGYWQLTEYAKMAQRYGAAKTIGYFVKEMPVFKHALETIATNKLESAHLKDILTNAATESMRLQPYVRRFADGFEMPANATMSARLQHSTQLVPYMNGLKWIHGHQARMMANLTIDSINRAVLGDAKIAKVLEQYGVTSEMLGVLKSDVAAHGMQVDAWSNGSWENVRPAFMKMMDEGVLHERIGDTPAFALLNPVGKFISTYRSFVLTSHNKLLAGTLAREGFDGVGLMLMYQYPLAALAVQAQTTINGKKELTGKELAYASLGQTGGLGLIGEVAGLLTGSKTQIGAPGMIPFDRAAKVVGEIGKDIKGTGSTAATMHAAFSMAPFLAILPPIKAMEGWYQKEAKEDAKTPK